MSTILEKSDDHTRRLMQGELGEAPVIEFETMQVMVGTFQWALDKLKNGHALTRSDWNGKGQFVYLVPPASYPAQTGIAKAHFGEGSLVPYHAYLALKDAQGYVATWVPSIGDLLSTSWELVDLA